ncbi:hypothetical protein SCHPADRAFT_886407 [Schizopora paradoxa]|uniref:Uncharacterized protein n=1 Tax=Schizopora paradoxa TaxID=27342 RepID=A0A0H2S8Y2_9AGAM|nr:hypothetical protein SCHPADRAFT_886407 [Schizopora paradoxa]
MPGGTISAPSLPPEILEDIFIDIVESSVVNERSWTALKLTHVCRSFRHAALGCPKLWCCLSRKLGRPGIALVEACVERSKDQPLEITLYFYPSISPSSGRKFSASDSMARVVVPLCQRWRRYSMIFTNDDHNNPQRHVITPSENISLFNGIKAPNLEELTIEKEVDETSVDQVDAFRKLGSTRLPMAVHFVSWGLPLLRSLTLANIPIYVLSNYLLAGHPSPPGVIFPTTYHVQAQSITVRYDGLPVFHELNKLRTFEKRETLKRMQLSFRKCYFNRSGIDAVPEIFSDVSNLVVDLIDCRQSDMYALFKTFTAFEFASLIDLNISITIGDQSFLLHDIHGSHDVTVTSFLSMRQTPIFPCLETLTLDVRQRCNVEDESSSLLLPHLILPPSLKLLFIHCPFALSLSYAVDGELEEADLSSDDSTTNSKIAFKLQTVTFDVSGTGGVVKWIHGIVMKMGTRYHWDDFRDLVIENQGRVVQAIERDDLKLGSSVEGGQVSEANEAFFCARAVFRVAGVGILQFNLKGSPTLSNKLGVAGPGGEAVPTPLINSEPWFIKNNSDNSKSPPFRYLKAR